MKYVRAMKAETRAMAWPMAVEEPKRNTHYFQKTIAYALPGPTAGSRLDRGKCPLKGSSAPIGPKYSDILKILIHWSSLLPWRGMTSRWVSAELELHKTSLMPTCCYQFDKYCRFRHFQKVHRPWLFWVRNRVPQAQGREICFIIIANETGHAGVGWRKFAGKVINRAV